MPRRLLIVLAVLATLSPPVSAQASGQLEVVFLAAGQLDAALYRAACGDVGLVDAGNGSADEILGQLDSWGARGRLRWVAPSHYDFDHLGAVETVGTAAGVSLDAVYDRGGARTVKDTSSYRSYYDWVTGRGLRQPVDIGDRFSLCSGADEVSFTVVSAGTDGTAAGGVAMSEENDRGVCLHVEHGDFDLATCGDVNGTDDGSRTDVESAVAGVYGDVEVAKVNHHGSVYSSNPTYVSTLSAEAAVLMVGNNGYGHPSPTVVSRWQAAGALFQTLDGDGQPVDGTITITTGGVDGFTVTTAAGATRELPMDEPGSGGPAPAPAPRTIEDACPPGEVPPAGFADVNPDGPHTAAIDCVTWWEIAQGQTVTHYQPWGPVRRDQMASFISRLIAETDGTLPDAPPDAFSDDDGIFHELAINQLAAAGIVSGTTPTTYNPQGQVSRAQMASFIARAYQYRTGSPLPDGGDYFPDDNDSLHHDNINRIAAAGITGGTSDGTYQPASQVTRAEMASFLARLADLLVEQGHGTPPDPAENGDPAAQISITRIRFRTTEGDVAYDAGEYVEIRNDDTFSVDLTGWYVTDRANHRLDWCPITLAPGATARLYTGPGDDGPDHCHAGRGTAVWNDDQDNATLYDPNGVQVDTWNYLTLQRT